MAPSPASLEGRVSRTCKRVLDLCTGSLALAIVGIALAQVFSRYVLELSLIWSEELMRLLFVWMVVLGAVSANHMKIDLVVERFFGMRRRLLVGFGLIVSLACLAVLVKGAWSLWWLMAADRYTSIPLSPGLLFAVVCVAGPLWGFVMIWRALRGEPGDETGIGPHTSQGGETGQ